MLELLTGRKPIEENRYIVREVKDVLQSPDGLTGMIDPVIQNTPILGGLKRFVDLAIRCVDLSPVNRPTMREVVKEIEAILESGDLDTSSTFLAPLPGEIRALNGCHSYDDLTSSQDISSNAFDRSAAMYILPTVVEPK